MLSEQSYAQQASNNEAVYVEYCRSCHTHNWCTHHDETKYHQTFLELSQLLNKEFPSLEVIGNMLPKHLLPFKIGQNKYIDSHTNKYVIFPPIGAFQIIYNGQLIFSKKNTNTWPSLYQIIQKIGKKINGQQNILKTVKKQKSSSRSPKTKEINSPLKKEEIQIDQKTIKDDYNNSYLEKVDKRSTFHKNKPNVFTLTDHFKMYRSRDYPEEKQKESLTENGMSSKSIQFYPTISKNQKRKENNSNNSSSNYLNGPEQSNRIRNQLIKKGFFSKEKGKRQMIIRLDSIQEENIGEETKRFEEEPEKILKKHKNSNKLRQFDDQLNQLQNKFKNIEERVSKIKNHTEESKSFLPEEKTRFSKLSALDQLQNKFRPESLTEIEKEEGRRLINKYAKLDQYIFASEEEKNQQLYKIYGQWKLLKNGPRKNKFAVKRKKKINQENKTEYKSKKDQDSSNSNESLQNSDSSFEEQNNKIYKKNRKDENKLMKKTKKDSTALFHDKTNQLSPNQESESKLKRFISMESFNQPNQNMIKVKDHKSPLSHISRNIYSQNSEKPFYQTYHQSKQRFSKKEDLSKKSEQIQHPYSNFYDQKAGSPTNKKVKQQQQKNMTKPLNQREIKAKFMNIKRKENINQRDNELSSSSQESLPKKLINNKKFQRKNERKQWEKQSSIENQHEYQNKKIRKDSNAVSISQNLKIKFNSKENQSEFSGQTLSMEQYHQKKSTALLQKRSEPIINQIKHEFQREKASHKQLKQQQRKINQYESVFSPKNSKDKSPKSNAIYHRTKKPIKLRKDKDESKKASKKLNKQSNILVQEQKCLLQANSEQESSSNSSQSENLSHSALSSEDFSSNSHQIQQPFVKNYSSNGVSPKKPIVFTTNQQSQMLSTHQQNHIINSENLEETFRTKISNKQAGKIRKNQNILQQKSDLVNKPEISQKIQNLTYKQQIFHCQIKKNQQQKDDFTMGRKQFTSLPKQTNEKIKTIKSKHKKDKKNKKQIQFLQVQENLIEKKQQKKKLKNINQKYDEKQKKSKNHNVVKTTFLEKNNPQVVNQHEQKNDENNNESGYSNSNQKPSDDQGIMEEKRQNFENKGNLINQQYNHQIQKKIETQMKLKNKKSNEKEIKQDKIVKNKQKAQEKQKKVNASNNICQKRQEVFQNQILLKQNNVCQHDQVHQKFNEENQVQSSEIISENQSNVSENQAKNNKQQQPRKQQKKMLNVKEQMINIQKKAKNNKKMKKQSEKNKTIQQHNLKVIKNNNDQAINLLKINNSNSENEGQEDISQVQQNEEQHEQIESSRDQQQIPIENKQAKSKSLKAKMTKLKQQKLQQKKEKIKKIKKIRKQKKNINEEQIIKNRNSINQLESDKQQMLAFVEDNEQESIEEAESEETQKSLSQNNEELRSNFQNKEEQDYQQDQSQESAQGELQEKAQDDEQDLQNQKQMENKSINRQSLQHSRLDKEEIIQIEENQTQIKEKLQRNNQIINLSQPFNENQSQNKIQIIKTDEKSKKLIEKLNNQVIDSEEDQISQLCGVYLQNLYQIFLENEYKNIEEENEVLNKCELQILEEENQNSLNSQQKINVNKCIEKLDSTSKELKQKPLKKQQKKSKKTRTNTDNTINQHHSKNVYHQVKETSLESRSIGIQKEATNEISVQTQNFYQDINRIQTKKLSFNEDFQMNQITLGKDTEINNKQSKLADLQKVSNPMNPVQSQKLQSYQNVSQKRNNLLTRKSSEEKERYVWKNKERKQIQRAKIIDKIYSESLRSELSKFQSLKTQQVDVDFREESFNARYKTLRQIYQKDDLMLFNNKSIELENISFNSNKLKNFRKILTILANKNQFLIIRLFENYTNEPLPSGNYYAVWLCNKYNWQCFIVDDLVQVDEEGQPLSTFHSNALIWAHILQKAFVKALGGYEQLQLQECSKLFTMLTGSNALSFKIKEDVTKNEKLLRFISESQNKNYIIHANKICKNLQQMNSNKKEATIYYIYSQKKLNGEQTLIELAQNDKPSFWMRISKFAQQFQWAEVLQLRVNHNFCCANMPKTSAQSFTVVELNFQEQSFGSITLAYLKGKGLLKAYLYREEKSQFLKLVGKAKQNNKSELFFDCLFKAGKYFAFVQSQGKPTRISFFGESKASLKISEEIQSEGLKNNFAEYLPVSYLNTNEREKQDSDFPDEINKNSTKFGSTGMNFKSNRDKISKLRDNFVEYLLNGEKSR